MIRSLPLVLAMLVGLMTGALWSQPNDKITANSGVVFGAYKEGKDIKFATRGGAFVVDGRHVVTSLTSCCGKTKEGVQTVPGVLMGGKLQAGKVLWSSQDLDLAIVEVDEDFGRPGTALVPMETVREGQAVFTALFDDADKPPEISQGAIQGTAKMDSGAILFKTNAALKKLNDGGGLFDACGNVVGATYTAKDGVVYVVTADPILQGLQASGVKAKTATQPCGNASSSGSSSGGGGGDGSKSGSGGGATKGKEKEEDDSPGGWRLPRGKEWIPVLLILALIGLAFRPAKRQVARALTGKHRVPVPEPAPYPYAAQPNAYPPNPYQPNPYQPAPYQGGPYQPAPYGSPQPPQNYGQALAPVIPMPEPSKPVLRGVAGQYSGTSVSIDVSPGILGRDPKLSNLVFTSETLSVSKRHCTVRWDPGRSVFVIEDHGSTNGTFLASGERLAPNQPRDLHVGDRFYIGDLRNQFEVAMES